MDYEKFITEASVYLSRKLGNNYLCVEKVKDGVFSIKTWDFLNMDSIETKTFYFNPSDPYEIVFSCFKTQTKYYYKELIKDGMKTAVDDNREPCEVEVTNRLAEIESLKKEKEGIKNKLHESERTVKGLVKQVESLNDELDVLKEALDTYSEKDEKIEELINLCDQKDDEIKLLKHSYDELKERTASLIANESDFEFIRAKLDCVVSILNDI